jgi:hypothetical protein
MQKVVVELSAKQAEQLFDQLPPAVKIRLARKWEREQWPDQLRQTLRRVQARVRKHPDWAKEALKAIGPARREFYARRRRRQRPA